MCTKDVFFLKSSEKDLDLLCYFKEEVWQCLGRHIYSHDYKYVGSRSGRGVQYLVFFHYFTDEDDAIQHASER